jgi:hypothetical protein
MWSPEPATAQTAKSLRAAHTKSCPVKCDPALRELWCAFISAALLVVIALCFKPLMQPHYDHHFHEARTVLHIVTFSNVPFFGIGVWGLCDLPHVDAPQCDCNTANLAS